MPCSSFHVAVPVHRPSTRSACSGYIDPSNPYEPTKIGQPSAPPTVMHSLPASLIAVQRVDELGPRRGLLDADVGEQVEVDEHAAVGDAAEVDRVDPAVPRAGVGDRRLVVVGDERLVGDVEQEAGLDEGLPVRRHGLAHVGLDGVGEPEDVDDVDVVGGEAGLGDGRQLVGVDDRHVDRHAGVGLLELVVEVLEELGHRWVLVHEDAQRDVVAGGVGALGDGGHGPHGHTGGSEDRQQRAADWSHVISPSNDAPEWRIRPLGALLGALPVRTIRESPDRVKRQWRTRSRPLTGKH